MHKDKGNVNITAVPFYTKNVTVQNHEQLRLSP